MAHLESFCSTTPAQRIDLADRLHLVTEKFDPERPVTVVGRKDLDHIAAHPERAAMKIHVVTLVLNLDQLFSSSSLP